MDVNRIENHIYLCKSNGEMLGGMNGLDYSSVSLTKNATDLWKIEFQVSRYIDDDGDICQSNWYDSIDEMMYIYLDNEKAYFVIDEEPTVINDGFQEIKQVVAHSCEVELNHINLKNFKVNCGTDDSLEYLAVDEEGNHYNINAYTNLPIKYISLVNYDDHQLSLLHLALENTDWVVSDNIDAELCDRKYSFETNSDIYSFFMKTVAPTARIIFVFNRKDKTIGIVDAEKYGEDTGIFIGMRNLLKDVNIKSSSSDHIKTKIIPTGANNLNIQYVNFGRDYIMNLDYFMNTINEYGDYKFVSKDLHDKYNTYVNYCDKDIIEYDGKEYTKRKLYSHLSKLYNQTILDISELKNKVPNDGCEVQYNTFSLEELQTSLKAYNNALVTLTNLYKNEFGVEDIGEAPGYTPIPNTCVNIKDTVYWDDFYAYKEKIIPQVEESLKRYCATDTDGNLVYDENGELIVLEFGNPYYYSDEEIVKDIDAWKYEWSLYGLDELNAKKKAWSEVANVLYDDCFLKEGTKSNPVSYIEPTKESWDNLTKEQRNNFTSFESFQSQLNNFLDYSSIEMRENSLVKRIDIGIIKQCDNAIAERQAEIDSVTAKQKDLAKTRNDLANSVVMKNVMINGDLLFTDKDLKVINRFIRETNYSNNNILSTNLDDIVSVVDIQEELYQDSYAKLYEISQPQYSFDSTIDNLYSIKEFKLYEEPFDIGNFIRVGTGLYEDEFVKLRLISMTYNPVMQTEDMNVQFSTMTKALNGTSDLASLLGNVQNSSGSSNRSSSSGGNYGDNDANVQMANSMLNALLSVETFGTAVKDIIISSIKGNKANFNTILAYSGIFDSIETGKIKINGEALVNYIKSQNWNGTKEDLFSNTSGTILDLAEGLFNFGGGKLTWDGDKLHVNGSGSFEGSITATSLLLGDGIKIDSDNIENLSTVAITGRYNDLLEKPDVVIKGEKIGEQSEDHSSAYTCVGEQLVADKAQLGNPIISSPTVEDINFGYGEKIMRDSNNQIVKMPSPITNNLENVSTYFGDDTISPEKLYNVQLSTFKFTGDTNQKLGATVEEIADKYSIAINYSADGTPISYDLDVLFFALLHLVQSQKKQIDVLETRINSLENNNPTNG